MFPVKILVNPFAHVMHMQEFQHTPAPIIEKVYI